MLHRRTFLGLLAAAPLAARPAFAGTPDVYASGGIAIHGIDPVGYFTDNAPVMGDPTHKIMWRGAIWHFANPDTMMAFEMNPTAYAPEYGGYCAYAMSKGAIATTVPEAWTISEGHLYLTYSVDVRTVWSEDIPGNVIRANGFWPAILAG